LLEFSDEFEVSFVLLISKTRLSHAITY
jgi:hypothetical protein